ncbi:MAG: MipA/OmpV family protein [Betaproteobacteria bacterium]
MHVRWSRRRPGAAWRRLAALLIALGAGHPGQAQADPVDNIRQILADPKTSPLPLGWLVGGMGYTGDSTFAARARSSLAIPGAVYVGREFSFLGDRGFYTFASTGAVSVFGRARVRLGSLDPGDSPAFAGMARRKTQLEAGLGVNAVTDIGLWSARFSSDVSGRSHGHEVLLSWTAPLVHERWILAPGIGLLWRSSRLADYFYGGVAAGEAAPGRPAYTVGGSWSINPSLALTYRPSSTWLVAGMAGYEAFGSEIRNSPLVQKRGTTGVVVAIGYLWR